MTITKREERKIINEIAPENGSGLLHLDKLLAKETLPKSVALYAHAVLEPDAEVGFHIHTGESETYYILKGIGEYNNDGQLSEVKAGDVTFTSSGHGHGIKNVGSEPLEFMALIVLD